MERQDTTGMGWFVAGLGLGALVGVLFAPKAGRETRESLMSGARESKEFVAARSKQAREQVNAAVDRGRDQIHEYAERGKEVAEKGRERWDSMVERVAGEKRGERGYGSQREEPSYSRDAAENRT